VHFLEGRPSDANVHEVHLDSLGLALALADGLLEAATFVGLARYAKLPFLLQGTQAEFLLQSYASPH